MDKKTLAYGVLAASIVGAGWRDAAAGAWLGVWTIALAPLAIHLLSRRSPRIAMPAVQAETLAWIDSGCGGPRGGQQGGVPGLSHAPIFRGVEPCPEAA